MAVSGDLSVASHTAIHTPERCIFAQLVNIGAFLREYRQTYFMSSFWRLTEQRFFSLSVCLSLCLPVSFCPSLSHSLCVSISLFLSLSLSLCLCLPVCLSVCLSFFPHQSILHTQLQISLSLGFIRVIRHELQNNPR